MRTGRFEGAGSGILIFDTGPLWELLLYSIVHQLRFHALTGHLQHLRTQAYYERLSEFVADFPRKMTTSHVVAEINARIIKTDRSGQAAIWRIVFTEFSAMGMDEDVMKLLEMPQDLVAGIGAVDVGILKLSESLRPMKPVVLSIDGALISECTHAGVTAKHLWEVIAA